MAQLTSVKELARVLAKNYFDTSQTVFPPPAAGDRQGRDAEKLRETARHVFKGRDAETLAAQPAERTVLVVGAGASLAAFGDAYPGSADAITQLEKALESSAAGRATGHAGGAGEARRPEADDDQDLEKFENRLAALAGKYGKSAVREELGRMYGDRHRPFLAFEIIAHLFKHRFIDVIINFNFDELLDEAIEGEMGTSEYRRVYFEGECTGLEKLVVDRRLKIPLYVKPHGTVSFPSSIRLTPDPKARLPEPMHRLLRSIIGGHWIDNPLERTPDYKPYPVNLIMVGFSMRSQHLLEIVREAGKARGSGGITLYHLNRFHPNRDDGLTELMQAAQQREWQKVEERFIDVEAVKRPDRNPLAETIRDLWTATKDHFQEAFHPRGIARHEFVHNLFYAASNGDAPARRVPKDDGQYFRARLYAEVAMAIARGNGQIDLATMEESRVGTTFDLMQNRPGGPHPSMHEILEPFARGEKVTLLGRDNSVFRFQYGFESGEDENAESLNRGMARALWDCLSDALEDVRDPSFKNHLDDIRNDKDRRDKMVDRLYRLAKSDAHDISPTFKHHLLAQQQRAKDIIHTSLGLTLRFVEMMNDSWDLMLAITETGKVMEKYRRHLKNKSITHAMEDKRFCLIVAGNDHPEIAQRRLKEYQPYLLGLGDPPFFYVPEWAHNQHMVLLLKRNGGAYRLVSAVRYETPRFGNRVNPVFVRTKAQKDLEAALECFKRYLHMSVTEFRPGSAEKSDPSSPLRKMDSDEVWAELLKGFNPPPSTGPTGARLPDSPQPPAAGTAKSATETSDGAPFF